jgi:hypothetical protein
MTGLWAFLTVIVGLGIIGDVVVKIIKASKSKNASADVQQTIGRFEEDLESMEREVEDARARIEVLEKIVTDDKYDLDKKIKDLA